jgi:hypothetical protein
MHRQIILLAFALACGGGSATKPDTKQVSNDDKKPNSDDPTQTSDDADAGPKTDDNAPKKDPCAGFEIDLASILMTAACEVPNPKPDDKSVDLKGKLEVTVSSPAPTVTPGSRVDLVLTLTNKTSSPLVLNFTLDPTPRFPTETYDAKKNRPDMPVGPHPPLPKGMAPREATSHETARITIVANGTAKTTIPWDAVKTKWAPEKLRGTPPEMGYPRVPAGPLAKGTYTVRVLVPLVLVFEGIEREVSGPKTTIIVK